MSEPHELSALEQGVLIAKGELSARELTEHYLARIDTWNAEVGAYITVCADLARSQADEADAVVRADVRPLGPLHGVPVPLKDTVDVAGVRTTYGSPIFADHVPAKSHPLIERIERDRKSVV